MRMRLLLRKWVFQMPPKNWDDHEAKQWRHKNIMQWFGDQASEKSNETVAGCPNQNGRSSL